MLHCFKSVYPAAQQIKWDFQQIFVELHLYLKYISSVQD